MHFDSKLPDVGTTIFTVMSRRALELGALNIGQGFPDYDIDLRLTELVTEAMAAGKNQYAPMEGVVELRREIAAKIQRNYAVTVDPDSEITMTCGGTEALFSAVQAVLRPGDEAIIFDPAYDSYEPAIRLAGGHAVRLALDPPHFKHDWDALKRELTPRTRLIIVNTPHNPACTAMSPNDLDGLAAAIRDRPITVLADEVYEHVVFDGLRHATVLQHLELRERSFAVFSFGKTLHATGWRVGYCVAPAMLTRELRRVHQFNTFSIVAPFQHAIAAYLAERPDTGRDLPDFFRAKRDLLLGLLQGSGFDFVPAAGTYFQLLDYGRISQASDLEFADRLLNKAKVATIPLSPFYAKPPRLTLLRVCLAKQDDTLKLAATRLREFGRT
jgi:methionine aminotransferase